MALLEQFFDCLIKDFRSRVLDLDLIVDGLKKRQVIHSFDDLQVDHVAFRTLGLPFVGAHSLEAVILKLGYTKRESISFDDRNVDAWWYEAPHNDYPKIFISQLRMTQISSRSKDVLRKYMGGISAYPFEDLDVSDGTAVAQALLTPCWTLPTRLDYKALLDDNDYLAWTLYHQYLPSHVSLSVHHLTEGYNTVELFSHFVEDLNLQLNCFGGKIKESQDGLLVQAATVADKILSPFKSESGDFETHDVLGSFVEFIERRFITDGSETYQDAMGRRDGFDYNNSSPLFASTTSYQPELF